MKAVVNLSLEPAEFLLIRQALTEAADINDEAATGMIESHHVSIQLRGKARQASKDYKALLAKLS